jgi:hypothetical protein
MYSEGGNYNGASEKYNKIPNYSKTSPDSSETTPNYSQVAPNFIKNTPNYSKTTEKYSKITPNFNTNVEKAFAKDCTTFPHDDSFATTSAVPSKLNSAADVLYQPSFNIKAEPQDTCHCINEETEDTESKLEDDESVISKINFPPPPIKSSQEKFSGKLLNRPKATNNISRDQVKPVEKEVQNEITKTGGKLSMKTSKPIRLPSPGPKLQSSPKNYDNESSNDDDFSSIDSQNGSGKENRKNSKTNGNQKNVESARQQSSLVRQEGKNIVIPNIHQGENLLI